MSSFEVTPTDLATAGASLSRIHDEVTSAHGDLLATTGSADDTPVSGAFEDTLDMFSSVMPGLAAVGAALSEHLNTAGANYTLTDTAVAKSAAEGSAGPGGS